MSYTCSRSSVYEYVASLAVSCCMYISTILSDNILQYEEKLLLSALTMMKRPRVVGVQLRCS